MLFLLCPIYMWAQSVEFNNGISVSLYFGDDLKYLVSYNANVSYPISVKSDDADAIIPMVDCKISFYNDNLGNSVLKAFKNKFNANIAFSPTVSYSTSFAKDEEIGFIPIFSETFSGVRNSNYLNNYGMSVSYIWQLAENENIRSQRVGNVFVSTKHTYFNYYNDGGPLNKIFGDKEDRYWTGGGSFGYKFVKNESYQTISLSFDKFTGFVKHAFEASGLLFADNVLYKNPKEASFNSGKYTLKYTNSGLYFGAAINWWNTPFDFQDFLHRDVSNNPYHNKLKKPFFDFQILGLYEN